MSEEEKSQNVQTTTQISQSSDLKPADSKSSPQLRQKKIAFPQYEKSTEIEKEDTHEITLKFDVIMMKDGLSKHQIFNIKGGDKFGDFEMFRNYKDFLEIRKILVQRWPGCYVPPLPKKKIVGDMDKENLKERMTFLEDFYTKISQLKFLYYSKEFQLFLRGNKNNADLEKSLKLLPAENYEEVLRKYSVCFAEINGVRYEF